MSLGVKLHLAPRQYDADKISPQKSRLVSIAI